MSLKIEDLSVGQKIQYGLGDHTTFQKVTAEGFVVMKNKYGEISSVYKTLFERHANTALVNIYPDGDTLPPVESKCPMPPVKPPRKPFKIKCDKCEKPLSEELSHEITLKASVVCYECLQNV